MKKYKLSILLASAVLGGVGATYLSAEANEVSAAEVKTEVVTPTTTTGKNEVKPAGATTTSPQATAPKEVKNIGEVQGESHESPLVGKEVVINNVVVTKTDQTGFYVQDKVSDNNPKTSDAVYVASKDKVESGDLLKVQGTVKEGYMEEYSVRPGQTFKKPAGSLTVTQIINATITKLGKTDLPKALNISEKMPKDIVDNTPTKYNPETEALDYWESLEGMRVEVTKPKVTGPQYKGDIYVLPGDYKGQKLNNIGGVNLRPGVQNTEVLPITVGNSFVAKAKDYFNENITGVVTYKNKTYKIDPIDPNALKGLLQDGGLTREVSKIYPSEDKLTIASYNIENFSANNNGHDETPEEKVDKIANSFIKEVHSPDIITLIEVQDNNGGVNDGTVDGVKSGEKLAQRIKSLGGPDYKYTEIAPVDGKDGGKPGANIRVAYLYNPKRVTLIGKEKGGSEEAARFVNGHLEKNPARIDPKSVHFEKVRKSLAAEFEFKGERIVVIANHLKSKLGDDAIYGSNQPSVENTKAKRIEEAKILNAFIKEGLRQNPNLKFVLTGDFNDFEFSDSVKTIVGNELVNLMAEHEQGDRYSYFYRGSNQSLDNILISKNIKDKVVFSPVHINASFMEEHGRASDHDPVVVQIDFSKPTAPGQPGTPVNPDGPKDSTNSVTSEQTGKDFVRTVRLADGVTVSVKYDESRINNVDKFVAQDITGERAKEIKELVKEFNSELNVVRTLELHFEDKDGKELKATGENRVVTLAVAKDENQQLKVYHVNGNVLEEIKDTSYTGGKLTFNTPHFSTFVIATQSSASRKNNSTQADAKNTISQETSNVQGDKKSRILPKTGLNSSSSLLFAGLSAVAAFILGRKRNKN